MEILYDLVPPHELTQYIRAWDLEINRWTSKFELETYLPNLMNDELEFSVRKGALNDVDAAEFRAFDTPARMTGRPGTTRISGALGPVSRMIPLGEEELLRTRALDRGTDDPIINAIYDDAERMMRSVDARVELARGDLIDDGKVTITENGLTLEADFGRSVSASKTAAKVWSDPTATILAELLGWNEDYYALNGSFPAAIRVTRQMKGYMALNNEIRAYAASNGTTPQRVNFDRLDAILAAEGLPPLWDYESTVRVNGVKTPVLPANKAYFMPATDEPLGNTFWGVTAEALKLREQGLIKREEAPGVVCVALQEEHPVQTFTLATALVMPAMPNPDLVFDLDVL